MRLRLVLALTALLAAPAAAKPVAHRAASAGPLPWIENDYPKAVALAQARKLPIFVEAWAPW
jgi:hypothetical protein